MEIKTAYIAQPEFISDLKQELQHPYEIYEDIFLSAERSLLCFAQDMWFEPQRITFQSISEAAKILRQHNKYWYLHPVSNIRRSHLILESLKNLPPIERQFPITEEIPVIGGFSLLDTNTLLFSTKRWKKWPDGKCFFVEDKVNPPNRAYLKLWEALTYLTQLPKDGDLALDLGASPGGWTYVLQSLGAHVLAVDKAELAPKIAKLPGVSYLQQSAFAINPLSSDCIYDYVVFDVACYPERAYSLILKWINSGKAKQMIFTIKLQGKINFEILKKLQAIENAQVLHLYYNKHEVTFFYPKISALSF